MKKLIFITNDDGVQAKGLRELIEWVRDLAEIVVVAPDRGRSGQSNAFTTSGLVKRRLVKREPGLTIFSCSGTPTDCVKMGLDATLSRVPDLLLSGINHGSNASVNVIYSGTMGAVLEGCEQEIPSIGFSLCDHDLEADFSQLKEPFLKMVKMALAGGLPKGVCLNVNAPMGKIAGVKVCRQAIGKWVEEFLPQPTDDADFEITGRYENLEPDADDTDIWAIDHGFISVVPTQIDLTAHAALDEIKRLGYGEF